MRRITFLVRGRVQGVGFRASAAAEARRCGLSGFVQNRADGAVAGEAQGAADGVAAFVRWLGQGPPLASVDSVDVAEVAYAPAGGAFTVRR
ncbi:MAG: acylphosphatase [Planctomycetes bacterium]|nr:acylphosphatase [Planctomycetota bacterium]